MKIEKTVDIQFADGIFPTTFILERQESMDGFHTRYILDAFTSTGFNLTHPSYGLLTSYFEASQKLRSVKSIRKEMIQILDDIIDLTSDVSKRFIIVSLTLKTKLRDSEWQFFKEIEPFSTCAIKSLESGNPISWYYHDVFNTSKEISITFSRKTCGQLTAQASESDLYDIDKLNDLAQSERFKERKFAFFFYDEVMRLINGNAPNGKTNSMSGLFA